MKNRPKDPWAIGRFYKAKALAHAGDFTVAALTIREVMALRRNEAWIFYTAARIQARSGMERDALMSLKNALNAGQNDVRVIRQAGDFTSLRTTHANEFDFLLKPQFEWSIEWGFLNDDIVITNRSAFPLTGVALSPEIKNGPKVYRPTLAPTPRLAPGESYKWVNAVSVSGSKADSATATLICEQL